MRTNHTLALGFTFIELVIIMVVIGILAVSVAPRFFGQNTAAKLAATEAQLASLLRLQQQNAMQDTSSFGYGVDLAADSIRPVVPSGRTMTGTEQRIVLNQEIRLSPIRNLYFNAKGCPVGAAGGVCGEGKIIITLSAGTESRSVCVQSQGYIHSGACS